MTFTRGRFNLFSQSSKNDMSPKLLIDAKVVIRFAPSEGIVGRRLVCRTKALTCEAERTRFYALRTSNQGNPFLVFPRLTSKGRAFRACSVRRGHFRRCCNERAFYSPEAEKGKATVGSTIFLIKPPH